MYNYFINNIHSFRGKILFLCLLSLAFCYGLLGAMKLASEQQEKHTAHITEPTPLVVVTDRNGIKKVIPAEDFLEAASSEQNKLNLSAEDLINIAKLKRELDLGKAQIELLRKLTEKKDSPKDSPTTIGIKKYIKTLKSWFYDPVVSGLTTFGLMGTTVALVWYFSPSIMNLFLWFKGYSIPSAGQTPTNTDLNPDGSTKDYCFGLECHPERCNNKDPWWYFGGPTDCPQQ